MWMRCRDGRGGFRFLPEAGGVGEQAAKLMDAMDMLETDYLAAMPPPERRR